MATIAVNLAAIHARIATACAQHGRDPAAINLVAVTKTQDPAALAELADAGQLVFGENRTDHLAMMAESAPPDSVFHYIGRVQGRQFNNIVPLIDCLHSLADIGHVDRLERACTQADKQLQVFLQVNTSGEDQKAGCPADDLPALLEACRSAPHIDPIGLMCMAPALPVADESTVRQCFAATRELAGLHGLERLSMGMSGDFEMAIAEGATDLRIGSVLFA